MRRSCLVLVGCLSIHGLAAAGVPVKLLTWINTDGKIVVRLNQLDDDETLALGGLGLYSTGGYLGQPLGPEPFMFLLANREDEVAFANVGSPLKIDDRDFPTDVGYDLERALSDGVRPSDDLYAQTDSSGNRGFKFQPLPGDATMDGTVDFEDFLIVSRNFGVSDLAWPDGDFDWDFKVGFSDFLLLADNYSGRMPRAAAAVPEPSTATMATALALLLLGIIRPSIPWALKTA